VITAEQRVKVLESELRIANAEIARLRRRLNERGAHGKRVQRAYSDALLLAELAIAYLPTTRSFAESHAGITHVRWENAKALLRLARVHSGRGWLVHDLATIEAALSKAVEKSMETPEAYRARLPRHARHTE
jgi:hypothetical protein